MHTYKYTHKRRKRAEGNKAAVVRRGGYVTAAAYAKIRKRGKNETAHKRIHMHIDMCVCGFVNERCCGRIIEALTKQTSIS